MSQKKNLRRSNGEGTFFQSHGKWRGQFSIIKDNKLIRRAFSGNSKLEVYKLGKQWIEATQQNTSIFSSKNTKLKDVFGNIMDTTVKEFSKILDRKDLKYTQENMKIYFEKVDGEWVPQMDFKKNKDLMKIMSFNLSNDLF